MRGAPRFLVFGAGATGSVFAARLAARHKVAVVARGAHLEAIRRDGLRVRGATGAVVRIPAGDAPEGPPPDFVLVTVKAGDTAAAAEALRGLPSAVLVSLQNGLGNEETLAATGLPVAGAVSNVGATLEAPGRVFHAGLGPVILGNHRAVPGECLERLAACLREVGFPVRLVADIRIPLWEKAILNAAVNPVTGLLGLRTGALLDDPGVVRIVRRIVGEAVRVAAAEGAAVSPDAVRASIEWVVAATADNRSSMLQDLERGRRTEIDAINGEIVTRAERRGIPVPWNRLMVRLVRERDQAGPVATGRSGAAIHSDQEPE